MTNYLYHNFIGKPVCDDSTCDHGKCIEVSQSEFRCDCTGTLYTGKRCHRGLILVPDIGEVKSGVGFPLQITAAEPNEAMKIALRDSCSPGGSYFFPVPCEIEFKPSKTTATSIIRVYAPGIYYLKFNIKGPNAADYDAPQPLPIIVSSGLDPYYFKKLKSPYVYNSCCQPDRSMPLLRCGANPNNRVQFTSSCSWNSFGSSGSKTNGIVFSKYKNLSLPVSVAGLEITKTDLSVSLSVPSTAIVLACDNCKKLLQDLKVIHSDEQCYNYRPLVEDLREFTSKQSLTRTFIRETQAKLMPNWLKFIVPDERNTHRSLVESDYRVSITSETEVLDLVGCESLILDKTGQFSVLLHNGPLDIDLNVSALNTERYPLSTPIKGQFYCIAVELCSGDSSPLYVGIPRSSQAEIVKIGFLDEFVRKGWKFTMHSFILRSTPVRTNDVFRYWNGLTQDYMLPMLESDIKINMESTGSFSYGMTNISFSFSGNVSYKYTLRRNEVGLCNRYCMLKFFVVLIFVFYVETANLCMQNLILPALSILAHPPK